MGFKTTLGQQLKAFNEFWEPFFIYGFNGGFLCFLIHVLIIFRRPDVAITKILLTSSLGAVIVFLLFGSFVGIVAISKLKNSDVQYKFSLSWYALLAFVGGFVLISLTGFLLIILINWLKK